MDTPNVNAPGYKGETAAAIAAFDAYVKMGDERSISALARKLKRAEKTLNNWSKRFQWRERLIAMQEEARKRAEEEIKEAYFAEAKNLRSFKYTILDTLKKRFEVGHYCPECETPRCSVNEMISILHAIKTELYEPTSITKNTTPDPGNDPFALLLSRLFPAHANADAKAGTP